MLSGNGRIASTTTKPMLLGRSTAIVQAKNTYMLSLVIVA